MTLTASATHGYYIGNTDAVLSNYGKGNYLYDTLTVTGTGFGKARIFSVKDIEQLAYDKKSGLGYEGKYSFLTRGNHFNTAVMTGLKLYDFLIYCGMPQTLDNETEVTVFARDGYTIPLTLGDIRQTGYACFSSESATLPEKTGLPVLLSFGSCGVPLVGPTGDEPVSTVFTAAMGYNAAADNVGGPLRLTIGQNAANEFNAPYNNKWVSKVVVGSNADYAAHSDAGATASMLSVKLYSSKDLSLTASKSFSLAEIEAFATASNLRMQNYYADGAYYEGVSIWSFLTKKISLPDYEGSAIFHFADGSSVSFDLAYLRNLGGNFKNYITQKGGLTLDSVKPIFAFAKDGHPTADDALIAALPCDGVYLSHATVAPCTGIDLYLGELHDVHTGADALKTVRFYGSGLKAEHTLAARDLESRLDLITSGTYSVYGSSALYRGLDLLSLIKDLGLTVDAYQAILTGDGGTLSYYISDLEKAAEPALLAFSRENTAISSADGGPMMCVSALYVSKNITSVEVTAKAGWWDHFAAGYTQYLPNTLKISGPEAKAATLTLRDLETMPDITVRDSFAASGGKNGYQGVVLRELIQKYMADPKATPSSVTVVASDGYRVTLDVNDIKNGIVSHYQPGEKRDILLAYSMDGAPLVPSVTSKGYTGNNAFGPLRIVVENTISLWVKNVSEIIIGS